MKKVAESKKDLEVKILKAQLENLQKHNRLLDGVKGMFDLMPPFMEKLMKAAEKESELKH